MIDIRTVSKASVAALFALAVAAPALADDLTLAKGEATDLVMSDVGKPYWALESQCAGMFGAAYAYMTERGRSAEADQMKQNGILMLSNALGRLQADRGVDRNAAMGVAAGEVETGRAAAKGELAKSGDGPNSGWNMLRSACLDISEAAQRHPAPN